MAKEIHKVTPGSPIRHDRFEPGAAWLLLAVTLVVSLLLLKAPGTRDVEMFLIWGNLGHEHGLAAGYRMMVDHWPETVLGGNRSAGGGEYPPLGFAWLGLVAGLADALGISHFLAFKSAVLGFSFASSAMIGLVSRSVALAAAFQGATLLGAAGLGYMDVVAAPLLIGAVWAIREDRPLSGFLLLLLAVLVKWQVAIIAPFLLVHMLGITGYRALGRAAAGPLAWRLALVLLAVVLGTGAIFGTAPVQALRWALAHPFLSGNALNLPWVATFLLRLGFAADFAIGDEVAYVTLPAIYLAPFRLVFLALFTLVLLRAMRCVAGFADTMLFCVLGVLTYGVWNSAAHENHWFIALVPAFVLAGAARDRPAGWVCVLVAVMVNVNLFVFYGISGREILARNLGIDLSVILALLFTAIWVLVLRYAWSLPRAASGQT